MKEIVVNLGKNSYPIIIESNGLSKIGKVVQNYCTGESAAVITDETVGRIYGNAVMQYLHNAGIHSHLYTVKDGENSKSLENMNQLYTWLIDINLHRDDSIIALGGGVVGDLAGFLAATYLRGLSYVQVPTSLLAQVDSSVGGKVGINHSLGKNLIGSFYHPKCVLVDPETLATLASREMWAGLGEVVKYGFILGESFFQFLVENIQSLQSLEDMHKIIHMITECCQCKANIVHEDEKEDGQRRILNFGHTLGHALEAVTNFQYFKHGEAIIYGMYWAIWLSYKQQYISQSDLKRMTGLLKMFPIPELPNIVETDNIMAKIHIDKKQTMKGLNIILLEGLGKTKIVNVADVKEYIEGWLKYVHE